MNFKKNKLELTEQGFSICSDLYTETEVAEIIRLVDSMDTDHSSFLKTTSLFAIRQFMNHIPELSKLIYNENLLKLIKEVGGENYFLTKAIYFDKPAGSNWFVAYHQDLSISVADKTEIGEYENWTFKKGQYGVQPPVHILENIITIRIHLDETNEGNGALKVIPKSHTKGIYRPTAINWEEVKEVFCKVGKGGVMLMKPLIFHSSSRSTTNTQRRVIHLEFSNQELAAPLRWLERKEILVES
ncbi:MAG: phytanoyl-CoA dioxygenase family protein [Flavobacteriaceae bacterium]|nr:phytanoyl-CoA dioxygenase family protein [Flavobacteriaceae bacterium]